MALLVLSFISGCHEDGWRRLLTAGSGWLEADRSRSAAQVRWNARDGRMREQPGRARRKKKEARRTAAGHAADGGRQFKVHAAAEIHAALLLSVSYCELSIV
ncbi:hypothetical protein SESBI_41799 [Sesbania bispinosa]|nr:hypothetical protein SESBI_41799 [Sesbania bispinosa]